MPTCPYCTSNKLTLRFQGMVHPFKKDHGPFDIYRCRDCRSLTTYPMPTAQQQSELYNSFRNGFIPALSELRQQHSLTVWYDQCINRGVKQLKSVPSKNTEFTWIDVGAGSGELAIRMMEKYPASKGYAIDFHESPKEFNEEGNLKWVQADLNEPDFAEKLHPIQPDLILSITVLEHIIQPEIFLKNLLQMIKEKGSIYLTVPCTNSFASEVLGKKWPYLIPGEHLTIPSKKGMKSLLQRITNRNSNDLFVKETILPYTAGYYLDFLKLGFLKRIIPAKWPVRVRTGILEAGLRKG